MCLARRIHCIRVPSFLFLAKRVDFVQMGLALDVSDRDSWYVLRARLFFCTFNETLLFLGWRGAKLARTSGPTKCFDVMHSGYAFPMKHIKIQGGVEEVIYGILVVSQHGKGNWLIGMYILLILLLFIS